MKKLSSKINSQKGYTLLFAVIVSVLVLSIAAFILSVSRKQAILASSARDSIYAFYAADSGLECAVENLDNLATTSDPNGGGLTGTINCGNKSIKVAYDSTNGDMNADSNTAGTSTFTMANGDTTAPGAASTQSGVASCASTTITYTHVVPGGLITATSTFVIVSSRGYNIGWNGTNCSLSGPRKVERTLQFTQER